MTKKERTLCVKRSRPCYVSDCQSGELPGDGDLCCYEHRRFEHLARFNTRMEEIIVAAALDTLDPAASPN